MTPQRHRLSTCAEIAGYLGVSIRQAQYHEEHDGLPVRRLEGQRRRVFAFVNELDVWRAGELRPIGTEPPPPRRSRILSVAALALGALVIGVVLLWPVRSPEEWHIRGRVLTVYDSNGRVLWSHQFDREAAESDTINRGILARSGREAAFSRLWTGNGAEEDLVPQERLRSRP